MIPTLCLFGISGLAVLSFLVSRNLSRYPAFCWYVYSSLAQWIMTPVFMAISRRPGMRYSYFWFYCAHELVTDVLVLFVIRELYQRVYGPRRALPAWVPASVRMRVMAVAAFSCTLTALFGVTNGLGHLAVLIRVEQFASILLFLLFWVLAIYAQAIGLGFPGRVAGIANGFVLYMTFNLFAVAFRGQLGSGAPLYAKLAGSITYIASLGWWCWTARRKEATIALSQEQWSILVREFSQI